MISGLFITLGLVGVLAILIYAFLTSNFDHWKRLGVKGPKPQALFGTFPSVVTQKRHMAFDMFDIYKRYKNDEDFVGVFSIRTPQLMVTSPDFAQKVIVKDFKNFRDHEASFWVDQDKDPIMADNPMVLRGDQWRERRQNIVPALTANRIKAVYPVTQDVCRRLVEYVRGRVKQGYSQGIDAKDYSIYTSEVVSDCVLGVKAQSLTDNPTLVLKMTKTLFSMSTSFMLYFALAGLWPNIKNFYKVKFIQKDTEEYFLGIFRTAFDLRRKTNIDRGDVLTYILTTHEQTASHTMTFLLDGFETSASVMTHCLLQLARKPSTQDTLLSEIKSTMDENGSIDFEKLQDMPYLDQCIHESMRLIPPLLWSARICTEPCEFTNRNGAKLQLKVDDVVLVPVFSFHHDEDFFPNAEEFIPERFNPENGGVKKFRDMGVFYPFGDGPRICLGMKFALTQVKAALVKIILNYKVRVNPKTRNDNQLNSASFIGELAGGIWLDIEERD